MGSVGTANGIRASLGARLGNRIGTVAMRRITIALFAAAVLVSGIGFSGSSHPATPSHSVAAAP